MTNPETTPTVAETPAPETPAAEPQFKPLPGIDQTASADNPVTAPGAVHAEPPAPIPAPVVPHLIDPETQAPTGGAVDPSTTSLGVTASLPVDQAMMASGAPIVERTSQLDRIEALFQKLLPLVQNQGQFIQEQLKQALTNPDVIDAIAGSLLQHEGFRMAASQPYQPAPPKADDLEITVSRTREHDGQMPARLYPETDDMHPGELITYQQGPNGVMSTRFNPDIEEVILMQLTEQNYPADGSLFYVSVRKK